MKMLENMKEILVYRREAVFFCEKNYKKEEYERYC
jgi:hypothetical protein